MAARKTRQEILDEAVSPANMALAEQAAYHLNKYLELSRRIAARGNGLFKRNGLSKEGLEAIARSCRRSS